MARKKSKRSSLKPAGSKRYKQKLDTVFACPVCANDRAVDCRIDRVKSIGIAACRMCGASFQMAANSLTEPIDIYGDWMDQIADKEQKK